MKLKIGKNKIQIANSYIVSSISITLVLLVLGFFALLLLNTNDLSKSAKENVLVSVILKPDAQQGEIDEFQKQIAASDFCKSIDLVTPDEALEDLKEDLGQEIGNVLDFNPLPTSINIYPNAEYANTDSLQVIETALKQNPIVDDIFYNRSMVYQLDKNVKKITVSVLILEILLLIMAFSLINNTIRLLIYANRFEIKTMQLVGATAWFIMKPFLIKSFWHGLISSLVAIAALVAAILYYQSSVDDIIKIGHLEAVFGIVLASGLIITTVSTFLSVLKFIYTKTENLYI